MTELRHAATAVLLAALLFVPAAGPSAKEPLIGTRQSLVFQQTCAHCHVRPGIGAPVLGDEDEWASRRAKGFETLVTHTVEGMGGMPPLGTCSFCTEDDLRRLVAFIAGFGALPEGTRERDEAAQ